VSPRKGALLYYLRMRCVPVLVDGQTALRGKIALSADWKGGGVEDGALKISCRKWLGASAYLLCTCCL
jgi:hypothetical protein